MEWGRRAPVSWEALVRSTYETSWGGGTFKAPLNKLHVSLLGEVGHFEIFVKRE
jgi:hypothetical protein